MNSEKAYKLKLSIKRLKEVIKNSAELESK